MFQLTYASRIGRITIRFLFFTHFFVVVLTCIFLVIMHVIVDNVIFMDYTVTESWEGVREDVSIYKRARA